ncbi:MAG TPA: hypothetical protein VGO34_02920 [Alphaproteobacteria bacterium]|jgi:hypothetical protein
MAKVIGGLAMSHAPQLLMPPEKWSDLPNRTKGPFSPKAGIESEINVETFVAKSQRCHAALAEMRAKLTAWAPDVVLVMGDDQHENILDDNMPPFVLFTSPKVEATRHFTYLGASGADQMDEYRVDTGLADGLLAGLMDAGFDPAWSRETRDELGLGHAFGRALKFVMPEKQSAILPLMVNTYYPPAPSAKRCVQLGQAIRQVIDGLPTDQRVVVLASGGLSHTKIDEKLDAELLSALERSDLDYMGKMRSDVLVEGTSEIRNWIIAAGILNRGARVIDYVPCYRNANGVGCGMGFAIWE